jgi:hypothetical protein
MRARIPILLLLLALLATGYLLWTQWRVVDLGIQERIQLAEEERHAYVVSHDFDLLKAKLIEVHRDHWTEVARLEGQARLASIALLVMALILIWLLRREFGRTPLRQGTITNGPPRE